MSTRDPVMPAPGYARRWAKLAFGLLTSTPWTLLLPLLAAGAVGAVVLLGWPLLNALDPALRWGYGLLLAFLLGAGALGLLPIVWTLFLADGHRLPLHHALRPAPIVFLGASAIPFLLGVLWFLSSLLTDHTPPEDIGAPHDALLLSAPIGHAFVDAFLLGVGAIVRGAILLILFSGFALVTTVGDGGGAALLAHYHKAFLRRTPLPHTIGYAGAGGLAILSIFAPLVAGPFLLFFLAWCYVGAREMMGGGTTNSAPASLLPSTPVAQPT